MNRINRMFATGMGTCLLTACLLTGCAGKENAGLSEADAPQLAEEQTESSTSQQTEEQTGSSASQQAEEQAESSPPKQTEIQPEGASGDEAALGQEQQPEIPREPLEVLSMETVDTIESAGLKEYSQYTLQEIPLITDHIAGSSFGFTTLDTENTCEGMPVTKVPKSEGTLVLRNWNTSDLSAYTPGGEVCFMVRSEGADSLTVGLQDHVPEREPTERISYITVSDLSEEWQQVTIPLADFYAQEEAPDDRYLWTVKLRANGDAYISNMVIASPDPETVYPTVKLNQVGYLPEAEKVALASGFREILLCDETTPFYVVRTDSREAVFSGTMSLVTDYDEHSGEAVYAMDFSGLREAGNYQVLFTDGGGVACESVSFTIGGDAYDGLLKDVCRYYYFQRANVELEEAYAGEWAREGLHQEDFAMPFLSDETQTRDVSGGWFDAGDFGKYVDPGASAVIDLLWTYHFFAEEFYDRQNQIPESGNGIPDLLDEIRVELDFILKMQDTADGGFYHRVNPDDSSRRLVDTFGADGGNVKSTSATASSAAVLAFASVYYREFDAAYSSTLLHAAEQGWDYTVEHPDITSTGTYGTEELDSQRLWAACTLYYATGEKEYHDYIKAHYTVFEDGFDIYAFGHGAESMEKLAYFTYLLCEETSSEITNWVLPKYTNWKKEMLKNISDNPWRTVLPTWGYWWGSNSNALKAVMEMYIGDRLLGNDLTEAGSAAQDVLDYILGRNPLSMSYVTGEGQRSISCTYSGIFGQDGREGFPAGYMPGGVNSYDNWVVSKYPAKCYDDSTFDWVSNENAIYYNSPLVFMTALCKQGGK